MILPYLILLKHQLYRLTLKIRIVFRQEFSLRRILSDRFNSIIYHFYWWGLSHSIKKCPFKKSLFFDWWESLFGDYTVTLCDWNVISFNKINKVVYFRENSLILPPQFWLNLEYRLILLLTWKLVDQIIGNNPSFITKNIE